MNPFFAQPAVFNQSRFDGGGVFCGACVSSLAELSTTVFMWDK